MRRSSRPILASACVLALAGCNDHRFGFFPATESDGGSTDSPTSTISATEPTTTLSPTTVQPTVPTTAQPTITITSATDTTSTDPTATVTTFDPTGGIDCGEVDLGSNIPTTVSGSLAGQGDGFSLTCGGVGGSDIALLWTAPFTGRFRIDTVGSNFDSLLAVIDGACFGKELACDDDGGGELTSMLEVDLAGGQTVTVVIDSFGQSAGEFVLNIAQVPGADECPDAAFDPVVPIEIEGQTLGASDLRSSGCGGFGAPEIEALWTAPFDGQFVFEVVQADFDPVLYLLAGGSCNGIELTCSNDSNGPMPVVVQPLSAGEQVIVVVDGNGATAGKFILSIHE